MGQLYKTEKSKLKNVTSKGSAMDYAVNMLQEADRRVKRNTVNEPLFYKDKKSTANLKRSILSDRKLVPANSTKEDKNRIVAKHLRAYKEIFSQNGEPSINIGENIIARTHYNEPDNTIELARASNKKLLEELAHASQNKEGTSVWGRTAGEWLLRPYFSNEGQKETYNRPGSIEYEAHKEIEPVLRKEYNEILERNDKYEKYRNYVDNSKSAYKFAMGGSMYKTTAEYENARNNYTNEKAKALGYNDFQNELYTQSGKTRGTSETPRQLGDMFNTLSPQQQESMAAKYKAEFVTNTPSAQRRNYVNSMEMTVPGKGTGYYSFPTNDVVYGTKVLERPSLQMTAMKAKPYQPITTATRPLAGQPIRMPQQVMGQATARPMTQTTSGTMPTTKNYTSIVDMLNDRKMDSSFASRKKMAEERGIKNYTGSAAQNQSLLANSTFGNGGSMSMYGMGGKLSGKYLKMLAYGGDLVNQPNLGDEIDYTERGETTLEYLNGVPYQLPTTKSLVEKPIGTPIAMPTGQTATVNLDETAPNNSSLETMGAIGGIGTQLGAALIASRAQKKNNPNSTYTYDGQNRTAEGAKGIASGFALGNKIVPGIGGAVGAFAGGIYGIAKGSKMDKQAKLDRGYQDQMFKRSRDLEMEGRQRLQGEQQYGRNTQMYATGGNLSSKFLAGLNPDISQTSSSTTEINGKSHKDGGVEIPNMNAEVEKGETTSGDYVFSKQLGFAKIHKPIARAKGMIEEKPMTASRINSLKLLAEKEQKLSMAQEYIKKTLNLR